MVVVCLQNRCSFPWSPSHNVQDVLLVIRCSAQTVPNRRQTMVSYRYNGQHIADASAVLLHHIGVISLRVTKAGSEAGLSCSALLVRPQTSQVRKS